MTTETEAKFTLEMSPTIGKIAEALAKAQAVMGPAIKDKEGIIPGKDGRAGYRYGYATLAACFEALQPIYDNGIAVTQIPLPCANGVCVATLLIHSSGEWLRGELWMPATKQDAQGYGSALTYARRYGLSLLTGLASDDDDGEAATVQSRSGGPKPQPAAPKPVADLGAFATLCERVDAAENGAQLNLVASTAQKAHREGVINDSHLEQLRAAVRLKRNVLGQPTANGGPQ